MADDPQTGLATSPVQSGSDTYIGPSIGDEDQRGRNINTKDDLTTRWRHPRQGTSHLSGNASVPDRYL